MNDEIEPILIGEVDDIDVGSVENFEYDDINYAIYRLESGFFATEGNCPCAEKTLLSESSIEGCLLYTSPSPRDRQKSRMPSSA